MGKTPLIMKGNAGGELAPRFDVDAALVELQRVLERVQRSEDAGELTDATRKADVVILSLKQVEGAERAIRVAQRTKLEAMARLGVIAGAPEKHKGGRSKKRETVTAGHSFEGTAERKFVERCREPITPTEGSRSASGKTHSGASRLCALSRSLTRWFRFTWPATGPGSISAPGSATPPAASPSR